MAPSASDLRNRLHSEFPLIPPNVLDVVVDVYLQDPSFVKELARDMQTKERRGRGNAKVGRPPTQPLESKSISITPFAQFIKDNPSIFANAYDEEGNPRRTLEIEDGSVPSVQVEEISPSSSSSNNQRAAVECP